MSRLSIVVPVHNTESYLSRCLDSIVAQSFADFELILVDDGSTDGSPMICDEYSKNDSRVRVIHKKNEGVSVARNIGMMEAKGDYLTVVDSDDWLERDMYQLMFQYIDRYDSDVVMCDCVKDYNDRSEVYTHSIRPGFYNYEQLKKEYYPHLLMMENVEYPATISNWLIVWKKTITEGNHIEYLEGVRNSEDLLFGAQIMSEARSFFYIKGEALYHHCLRNESASNVFASDRWEDYKKIYTESIKYFAKTHEYDFGNQINSMALFFLFNYFEEIRHSKLSTNEKNRIIIKLLDDEMVRNTFSAIKITNLLISRKQKIKTYMLKYRIGINYLLRNQ